MAGRTYVVLGLILSLALALRYPGWFTQDEKTRFRLFEPDEFQHVQIAVYQIQHLDQSLLTEWDVERKIFNARSYGTQLGSLAWLNHRIWGMPLTTDHLILLGRILSTFYALLLIVLIFLLACLFFKSKEIALMAALLMAICDLNITYSHYALPASSYVFWTYAFVGSCCLFLRKMHTKHSEKRPLLPTVFMAFTAGAGFATKFDFIPLMIGLFMFLLLWWKQQLDWKNVLGFSLAFSAFSLFSFCLLTGFNFSLERIQYSFWDLYQQNKDVIPKDQHWLFNPLLYLIACVAGTSIPVATMGGIGFAGIWKKKAVWLPYLIVITSLLLLEFGVRWSSDIPFIRRANIFMPALVLLAAFGWSRTNNSRLRIGLAIFLIVYTLGLSLISQSNSWNDTRYAARTYLNENHTGQRIKYGSYAYARGMPPGIRLSEEEEILVLHETAYGRYWRSFTTPFRIPKCCEEVYHCGEEDCKFMQGLLAGDLPEYTLIRHFKTKEYFPERILFKKYLGNFETFLGDVLIFKKAPL